jgi:hypothetical protein
MSDARTQSNAPRREGADAAGPARPVRYSQAIARKICQRLAAGEVWFKICGTDALPAYGTLYDWRRRFPEFAKALAEAREMAADLRADKALVVAEAAVAGTVAADRLHIDALKWRAAKDAPERYGVAKVAAGAVGPLDAGARKLVIEVRQFERAWREDGTPYVREVLPDGRTIDRG